MQRWPRLALTIVLALLARTAFHNAYGYLPLIGDIDVAVHEFGHVLFEPFGIPIFGRTMVILGGSLFQVAFPLIFVFYFLYSRKFRDIHATTVCLWWTSINLLGVAIYANDARAGVLMLINGQTGQESDGHDWNNLFRIWGVLDKDTIIAARIRAVAVLLCFVSIVWGLAAAWQSDAGATPASNESDPSTTGDPRLSTFNRL